MAFFSDSNKTATQTRPVRVEVRAHVPGQEGEERRVRRLYRNGDAYERKVYVLPKKLDEEVARLHLQRIGVKLTTLTQKQADYIGVPVEGPYKPDHYRY